MQLIGDTFQAMPQEQSPYPASTRLGETHRDYELLTRLEAAILRQAKGKERFEVAIPALLRQSIDEVIDTPRSRRFLFSDLEPTEKTYLGTKIEILLRNHLKLDPGLRLDVLIDGVEVDIKNTSGRNWMIPKEAIGHPCILIRTDERRAKCWFGLVVIHAEILRLGLNQDKKSSISASNFQHIHWLLYEHDYPINFWEKVTPQVMKAVTAPRSGTGRLAELFRHFMRRPIERQVILALAPQKDTLKRLRKNGGARDKLQKEGIALLSGKYHSHIIAVLGLPECSPTEFISVKPSSEGDIALLRSSGELPDLLTG